MDRRLDGRYVGNDFKVKRVPSGVAYEDGNFAMKVFKATFDVSKTDSAGVVNTSITSHGLGVYLPPNSRIIDSWFDVITKMSSATNGATLQLTLEAAGDIKATSLISSGMYQNTGATQGLQDDTLTTAGSIKTTTEREVTVKVATEALISGKMVVYGSYIEEKGYL